MVRLTIVIGIEVEKIIKYIELYNCVLKNDRDEDGLGKVTEEALTDAECRD